MHRACQRQPDHAGQLGHRSRAALRTSNDGAIGSSRLSTQEPACRRRSPRRFAWRFRVRHGHVDAASGKLISQRRAYRARAGTTTAGFTGVATFVRGRAPVHNRSQGKGRD